MSGLDIEALARINAWAMRELARDKEQEAVRASQAAILDVIAQSTGTLISSFQSDSLERTKTSALALEKGLDRSLEQSMAESHHARLLQKARSRTQLLREWLKELEAR